MNLTASTAEGGFEITELIGQASGPGLVVLGILLVASVLVWIIWIAKWMQLTRLQGLARRFERATSHATNSAELLELADQMRDAPGAGVVRALGSRLHEPALSHDLLSAVAKRAINMEEQRASALMPTLSSIASASPFIGLFGTVWGIMIAFQKIGAEKSASLPVVAPAIGEALIATAFGLFAAIPATIGYNYVDRHIETLLSELSANADVWVARIFSGEIHARKSGNGSREA